VVSVLQLTSLLGLQSLELGVPVLMSELAAPRGETPGHEIGEDWLAQLARVDPAGAAATRGWIDGVRAGSPLEPKVVELIGVAVNASTTHLNEAAAARHIRAALAAGATGAEIVEVLELVAVLGIHSATMAVPLLTAELARS
jgi:alkylhydroperoxidase/carboxymuconolactone decarboxylase family protein YurZ